MPAGTPNKVIADRYRLEKKIGEGGMGEVYAAQHVYIEKRVAVKLVRNDLVSDELATRFQKEARAASLIGHPNIVAVDDFGRLPDGSVYIAMELLEGESLHDLLKRGEPIPLARVVDIMRQICRGLDAAHRKGIVHRDVKPENVFLDRRNGTEQVKILDFGIAKFTAEATGASQPSLTLNGTVFGTPSFMSPEQAMGKRLDPRSDLYSCGVMLYQLLTGTVPFKAESFVAVVMKHVNERPEPPAVRAPTRDIPPAIEAVVMRALAKDPDDRQQSMADLERELAAAMEDPGEARRPAGRWGMSPGLLWRLAAVGGLSVVLGLVLLTLFGPRPHRPPATQAPAADAAARPAPAAAAAVRVVLVDSTPAGAEILLDGRRLDETPANLSLPPGAVVRVVLRKAGWRDATLDVSADGPAKIVMALHAATEAAAPATRPGPRHAPGKRRPGVPRDVLLDPYQ